MTVGILWKQLVTLSSNKACDGGWLLCDRRHCAACERKDKELLMKALIFFVSPIALSASLLGSTFFPSRACSGGEAPKITEIPKQVEVTDRRLNARYGSAYATRESEAALESMEREYERAQELNRALQPAYSRPGAQGRLGKPQARPGVRVDLKRGLDPATLGALDLGNGEEEVVAFVDPRCPHCRSLLEKLPGLVDRYRFRLVPLPLLGPSSEKAVARLNCLAERDPAAAREALLSGDVDALSDAVGMCGQAQAQRALATARLLGIRGVPSLIAPDGRLRQGVPANLEAWLE
jgi:protein-disulfide isomerase